MSRAIDCRCGHLNAIPDDGPPGAAWDCGMCGQPLEDLEPLPPTMGQAASTPATGSTISAGTGLALVGLLVAGGLGAAWLLGAFGARGGEAAEDEANDSRSVAGYRGWERRRERDEFAAQNLDPEHLPLWRRIGGQFKGTPHERFERFVEYTEEHPEEVAGAQQEEADAKLEAMIGQHDPRCRCVDGDQPRCCGRGCCSHHRGIAGSSHGPARTVRPRREPAPQDDVPF